MVQNCATVGFRGQVAARRRRHLVRWFPHGGKLHIQWQLGDPAAMAPRAERGTPTAAPTSPNSPAQAASSGKGIRRYGYRCRGRRLGLRGRGVCCRRHGHHERGYRRKSAGNHWCEVERSAGLPASSAVGYGGGGIYVAGGHVTLTNDTIEYNTAAGIGQNGAFEPIPTLVGHGGGVCGRSWLPSVSIDSSPWPTPSQTRACNINIDGTYTLLK